MTSAETPEVPFRKLVTQVFGDMEETGFFGRKYKRYFNKRNENLQYYDKQKGWVSIPTAYEDKDFYT